MSDARPDGSSLSSYDFELPEELIALRPARPRRASRLLVAEGDATVAAHVSDLGRWLRPGDLLVLNNTKVIPARLAGERRRDSRHGSGVARVEATLIRREATDRWRALAKPGKRLSVGDRIHFDRLEAEIVEKGDGGEVVLAFPVGGPELDGAIAEAGVMPLPPYIAQRRAADQADFEDYQTVFASRPGAVAAPTASLHLDEVVLAELASAGVETVEVTLHVGAGTFLPVKGDDVSTHKMHAEWGEISSAAAAAINRAKDAGGRIIPVGTTALRLIESAADSAGRVGAWRGETDIFIRPGYRFRVTDGLMTNFHLPRSTLFMLVSALMATERMHRIYAEAIRLGFRFYSYGDSSLLIPE